MYTFTFVELELAQSCLGLRGERILRKGHAPKTQSTCFYGKKKKKTGKMSTLRPAVAEPTGDSFRFGERIISKSI